MLASQVLLTPLLFPLLAFSTPVAVQRLQARLERVPRGFVSLGEASSSQPITLTLALASSNVAGLEREFYAVSTPGSSRYGQYLSRDQVNSYLTPTVKARAAVSDWLSTYNITGRSIASAGDWISFSVPIATANDMLTARYETFAHAESGNIYPRTRAYSLPVYVADYIDHVHPTVVFDTPHPLNSILSAVGQPYSSRDNVNSNPCANAVTPGCLQHLYDIPLEPARSQNNSIAVSGFNQQSAQKDDLSQFLKKFRPDMSPNTSFNVVIPPFNGGPNLQCGACKNDSIGEANLDTQYTVGLATNVTVEFISVADTQGGLSDWLAMATYLLTLDETIPKVVTTSFGIDEDRANIAVKLCHLYLGLSARGVTSVWSTGDNGVGGQGSDEDKTCTQFVPNLPSTCPYITAVGATQVITNGNSTREVAAHFTGGGFSNLFAVPDYQKAAVSSYLSALRSTNQGLYNASGRAYPDVSAAGVNFRTIQGTKAVTTGGTSASTPVFASVIALLNDKLLAAGRPHLGFLNPWLYANAADILTDITEGNNNACQVSLFEVARDGWDPVTGLGTPNFQKMLAAALNASGGNGTQGDVVSDCS
ncbi:family S53 protease [Mycena polygramma]|nr:family S53 protease [Mycena polygramma]